MEGQNVTKFLGDYNHDLDRIMHLYGEEASKSEDTIRFWSKGIQALCSDRATFKFTISELSERFIYEDMIPTSIDNSVSVLRAHKEVVDLPFFTTKGFVEIAANSAAGWITSIFSTQQMVENSNSSKEMIYVPLLKATVEIFLEYVLRNDSEDQQLVLYSCQHGSNNEKDISFFYYVQQARLFYASQSHEIESTTPKGNTRNGPENIRLFLQTIKDSDIHYLEDYMVAKGLAIRSADHEIIKIILNIGSSSTQSGIIPIMQSMIQIRNLAVNAPDVVTEQDVAKLHMKSTILQLEKRITVLDVKINSHKQKALTYKVRYLYEYIYKVTRMNLPLKLRKWINLKNYKMLVSIIEIFLVLGDQVN